MLHYDFFHYFSSLSIGKYKNCFKDTVSWVQGFIYSKMYVKLLCFYYYDF